MVCVLNMEFPLPLHALSRNNSAIMAEIGSRELATVCTGAVELLKTQFFSFEMLRDCFYVSFLFLKSSICSCTFSGTAGLSPRILLLYSNRFLSDSNGLLINNNHMKSFGTKKHSNLILLYVRETQCLERKKND